MVYHPAMLHSEILTADRGELGIGLADGILLRREHSCLVACHGASIPLCNVTDAGLWRDMA